MGFFGNLFRKNTGKREQSRKKTGSTSNKQKASSAKSVSGKASTQQAVSQSNNSFAPSKQSTSADAINVLAILVLSQKQLDNTQTLVEQIIAQQRSNGYSPLQDMQLAVKVAGDSLGDIAYTYASIAYEFSDPGGDDFMDRTLDFSFQGSDGNLGKYYVVLDRRPA